MAVIAKFKVAERICRPSTGPGSLYDSVRLTPVMPTNDEIDEDSRFHASTPVGEINLTITNPSAIEQFQPGEDYYVRFEKAS